MRHAQLFVTYQYPILYHPDFNRRLRILTESADLLTMSSKALAGLYDCNLIHTYRRWGISPRPENVATSGSAREYMKLETIVKATGWVKRFKPSDKKPDAMAGLNFPCEGNCVQVKRV